MPTTVKEIFEALNHSPEATAIYNNSDIRIAYVNLKMLEIWDREDDIIGLNFGEVFPEFRQQGFDDILRNVWNTGQTYTAENTAADVKVNGKLTRFYFDFQYKALQKDGSTYAILHTAREVSDRMAAWAALAEKERRQKDLNDELASSNEEIQAYAEEYQAINEKLQGTLEELGNSYVQLQEAHHQLASTEGRAQYLLEHAPVAIGVYDVLTKSIQSVNTLFKELWAIDDYVGQLSLTSFLTVDWAYFFELNIAKVVETKSAETILDQKIDVSTNTQNVATFHNLIFQPITNQAGDVVSILIVGSEVTDQRLEKEKVDLALEQARLAKKAAGFGVFDFNLSNQQLTCDERCRESMFLDFDKALSYEDDFLARIIDADRQRVQRDIRKAFNVNNINNHVSTTFRVPDGNNGLRWIQLSGQVYYDRKGIAQRFIGTIADVTADRQLREQLRERERSLQESNEELATTMEELAASNEELHTTNEELQRAYKISEEINAELKDTYRKLTVSEERLEVAVRSSQLGVWDVNFQEKTLEWDSQAKSIFGLEGSAPIPYEERWSFIHPEDLNALQEAVEASKAISSKGAFMAQFRTCPTNEGKFRWVQLQGQVYFSPEEEPVRFAGTMLDITERIVSQQQIDVINRSIAQKEIEQRMIVEAGKIGTYSYDPSNKVVNTNRYFSDLLQLVENRDIYTDKVFRFPVYLSSNAEPVLLLDIISRQQNFDVEFEVADTLTGVKRWLRSIGQRLHDKETLKDMIYGVLLDITLQKNEEKRKMDFLGIVSHELKSPLTSLSGYIQILEGKSKNIEDKVFAKLLNSAARQNARMRSLIEGFLDVARIGDGKLALNRSSFDAGSLLKNVQQTYMETVHTHTLTFTAHGQYIINADQDKIEQVIINFVNNAIKYAPNGTIVQIDTELREGHFILRVTDQGPGISKEDQEKLFSRFFRVDNELTKQISGFGIGLYISREIINLHSGEIGIYSEYGQGATFWFKLPTNQ